MQPILKAVLTAINSTMMILQLRKRIRQSANNRKRWIRQKVFFIIDVKKEKVPGPYDSTDFITNFNLLRLGKKLLINEFFKPGFISNYNYLANLTTIYGTQNCLYSMQNRF